MKHLRMFSIVYHQCAGFLRESVNERFDRRTQADLVSSLATTRDLKMWQLQCAETRE